MTDYTACMYMRIGLRIIFGVLVGGGKHSPEDFVPLGRGANRSRPGSRHGI